MDSPEMESSWSQEYAAGFRCAMGLVLAAFVFCGASVAFAEEGAVGSTPASEADSEENERNRWGFEIGAGFLLHSQGQNARIVGSLRNDNYDPGLPSGPTNPEFITKPLEGLVEPALAPGFTVEATVLSPALFEHQYAPSLFLHVGYENLLEDSFATFRSIESYSSSDRPNLTAEECEGGSDLSSCDISSGFDTAIQNMWFLGVGVDLPTPAFEDRLRLRVALDYLGQEWKGPDFRWERNTTLQGGARSKQSVEASFPSLTTHSLGVGVAALVDVYEWKEFQVRLFLDTRFSWILNDTEQNYTVESEYGSFDINAGPEKFIAQAGGGLRIYWSPRW